MKPSHRQVLVSSVSLLLLPLLLLAAAVLLRLLRSPEAGPPTAVTEPAAAPSSEVASSSAGVSVTAVEAASVAGAAPLPGAGSGESGAAPLPPEALPSDEQASLWAAFSQARRAIRPLTAQQRTLPENEGALYLASNPGQKLRARFLPDGLRLLPGLPGSAWSVELSAAGAAAGGIRTAGTELEYVRPGLVEWYRNRPEGIEQGFTVEAPPAEGGALVVAVRVSGLQVEPLAGRDPGSSDLQFVDAAGEPVLSYTGLKSWDAKGRTLVARMEPAAGGLRIEVDATGAAYPVTIDPLIASLEAKLGPEVSGAGAEGDHFGTSVALDGETALIGAWGDDDQGSDSGAAYVFTRSGAAWTMEAKLTAADGAAYDAFGYSVSLSGDSALIGARGVDSSRGSAYVFTRDLQGLWTQQAKLSAVDDAAGDYFGYSVSLDGESALIGAYGDDDDGSNSGSAYVFTRSGGVWTQQAKLLATDGAAWDYFGHSVSLSGESALIGAVGDDDYRGSAYVFTRSGVVWTQQAKLLATDGAADDEFGWSVSLDGDSALIGAYGDENYRGSAYVFTRSGGVWIEQAKLTAADGAANDEFGTSVSLDGDSALIGAYGDDDQGSNSGSAYVFLRSGGVWTQQAKLTATDGAANDYFGYSVSLDGDSALIGAYGDDDQGSNSGSAYVLTGSGGAWGEQAKLNLGDGAAADWFGISVSLDGDTALIGAEGDDDQGSNSGSAYVFLRSGGVWTLQAKLTVLDGVAGDAFGGSVSLSGDSALIGARAVDDQGSNSGSAYVFTRSGGIWTLQAKLSAADGAAWDFFGRSVSLDGDSALIGAYADDDQGSNSGSAYVFVRSGGVWTQQAKLTAEDGVANDWFGISVSLSGDSALVGADRDDDQGSSSGSAYVFTRSGGAWTTRPEDKLTATDGAAGDSFGWSVSLSGDSALIGADGDDDQGANSGSAYVFVRDALGDWSEQAKLTAADGAAGDEFGISVSLDGDNALVGAHYDDNSSGSAYVFTRSGVVWTEQDKLTAVDGGANDWFGSSVSLDGETALIGAYVDDGIDTLGGSALDQGSVYVFRLSWIGPDSDGDGASDAWESANGFDTTSADDYKTLDSDGDGDPDLLELFQGTDRYSASEHYGLLPDGADGGAQTLSARYRRSTGASGVAARYHWSPNLSDWYVSGMDADGLRVAFSEAVVDSGPGYEIVEVTATVSLGSTTELFIRLEVLPTE